MNTTNKSINEQITEIHKLMDETFFSSGDDQYERLTSIHHHLKVIVQHIMKLEAKCYYINKKLDQTLGLRPSTPLPPTNGVS